LDQLSATLRAVNGQKAAEATGKVQELFSRLIEARDFRRISNIIEKNGE
jgi:hypothetical protein